MSSRLKSRLWHNTLYIKCIMFHFYFQSSLDLLCKQQNVFRWTSSLSSCQPSGMCGLFVVVFCFVFKICAYMHVQCSYKPNNFTRHVSNSPINPSLEMSQRWLVSFQLPATSTQPCHSVLFGCLRSRSSFSTLDSDMPKMCNKHDIRAAAEHRYSDKSGSESHNNFKRPAPWFTTH